MFRGAIARSTLRTSGVLGIRLVIQGGILIAVARLLGPSEYGVFAALTALAVLLGTFSSLGMHLVVLSEVSRQPERERDVLSYAIPVTLLCGSFLLLIYIFCSWIFISERPIALLSIALFGVAELLLQPLLTIASSQKMARDSISMSQVIMIMPLGLRLAAVLVIWAQDLSDALYVYSLCYVVSSLLALIFALYLLPSKWPSYGEYRSPSRPELGASIGFGVLNVTAAGPAELDKVAVAHLISPAEAGLYSAATRVIGAATLPVLALIFSIMPRLFRFHATSNANAPALHRLVLLACLGYGIVLCAGFWVFSGWLELFFGSHYVGIGDVLRWLVPAIPALVLRMAGGNILMAAGSNWLRASFESVGIVVLLACAIIFAPRLGLLGMAIALSCAEWVMALISVVMVWRLHPKAAPVSVE